MQVINKKFARPTKLDLVYIEDSPDYCTSTNQLFSQFTSTASPEVEQLPNNPNRLIAKRPLIAKASKQSLTKKSRKYRSNKSTRLSNGNKLARGAAKSAVRNAQRRNLDRIPKAQRLVSENNKLEQNKQESKLDNPTEEDNQTIKEEDLNQFNGQSSSSIIPQLTDQQHQELTDEQKEQLSELIEKHEEQKKIPPKIKQLGWLGTSGRECNRSSLSTDNCGLLCCGRGYHTERVLVKEKCNCRFVWCCSIVCDTCEYYKTIHYCK